MLSYISKSEHCSRLTHFITIPENSFNRPKGKVNHPEKKNSSTRNLCTFLSSAVGIVDTSKPTQNKEIIAFVYVAFF